MSCEVTLQGLFDVLVEMDLIGPKRRGPIKTAIKQYSAILGYSDPVLCPYHDYFKSDQPRNRVIEENAPKLLGSDAIRNLKNNISYILRKACEMKIIPAPESLVSWKNSTKLVRRSRYEHVQLPKYALEPVPASLHEEIAAYEIWSTSISNRQRPKSLQKRPVTFAHHRGTILREAGYLVKFKGVSPNSIDLLTIIDPTNAINYVEWCINQQGRFTTGSAVLLGRIIAIARYVHLSGGWKEQSLMVQQQIAELRKFRGSLGIPVKVRDREKRWLSLSQLEMVGRSVYPLNARRMSEVSKESRRQIERDRNPGDAVPRAFQFYAFRVLQSLIIRLLIRIPLRQRNLREMLWSPTIPEQGQNLYRNEGKWYLRFRGKELKIANVKGEEHVIAYPFPVDLAELLEEWLYKWRPIIIACQNEANRGKERTRTSQQYVFLGSQGYPLTQGAITHFVNSTTFRFTGVSVNPHMIRHIFATEYIKATNNFVDAAYMLGDTVETVINTYAKLFDEDCGKRASDWISRTLEAELPNHKHGTSHLTLPKLVYPRVP